jgi:hypothetical protein
MQAQSGTHGAHVADGGQHIYPRNGGVIPSAAMADGSVSQIAAALSGGDVPQAAKLSGFEGSRHWQGAAHRPPLAFESRGASPAVDQAFPHAVAEVCLPATLISMQYVRGGVAWGGGRCSTPRDSRKTPEVPIWVYWYEQRGGEHRVAGANSSPSWRLS